MTQTVAIILRFRRERAAEFERLFEDEEMPIWHDYKSSGKFIAASLTRVGDGSQMKDGTQDYILHVELPGMAEHNEHDSDPRFKSFLEKAQPMQPEEPLVWLGETLFQV